MWDGEWGRGLRGNVKFTVFRSHYSKWSVFGNLLLQMYYLKRIHELSELSPTSCKKDAGHNLCSYDTWISSVP